MGEIVFDSENANMTYSKADLAIELIWKKNINTEDFRQVYAKGVEFALNNKVHYFLSDLRNEGVVPLEDVQWLAKEIIAKAASMGIKKIALVTEDDVIFSSIYADLLKKKIEHFSIQVNIFTDIITARSWLLKKD